MNLYNNTTSNAIVNVASNISYMRLLEAVYAVRFMNELKNLTNIVIGKLGKLVHKQNCSHDLDHHQKKFICQRVSWYVLTNDQLHLDNQNQNSPVAYILHLVVYALFCFK